MSAPDVNIERQKKRHHTMVKGLWIGAAVAILVALGLFVANHVVGLDALSPTAAGLTN